MTDVKRDVFAKAREHVAKEQRPLGPDIIAAWDMMPELQQHMPHSLYLRLAVALCYEVDATEVAQFGMSWRERQSKRTENAQHGWDH